MNLITVTTKGEAGKPLAAPKHIQDSKVSPLLLAQAVRVYLGNQRRASAKTKTRSDVNKTTAKMFKQKGTGNARHGSYAAPVFVGGGVAHGPDGRQNYARKMTKALVGRALLGALGERIKGKSVWVLQDTDNLDGKSKTTAKLITTIDGLKKPLLAVFTKEQVSVAKGFRNITGVDLIQPNQINTYVILKSSSILASKEAWEELVKQTEKYVN